jgi:hypothetical protein
MYPHVTQFETRQMQVEAQRRLHLEREARAHRVRDRLQPVLSGRRVGSSGQAKPCQSAT